MMLRLLAVPALVLALLTPALPASADSTSSSTDGNSWYIVETNDASSWG